MRCNHSISKSISLLSNRRQRVSALRWSTTMTDMATFCRSSCRCGVDTRRPTRDTSANWLQSFHISFCSVVEMGATQSIARTEGPTTAGAAATNAAAAGQEASASEPYAPAPMPRLKRAETFEEKLYRKFSEEPLVPIGCLATAYCLGAGIRSFYRRDTHNQQKMMRLRVAAQFGTLMIFIGYAGWNAFSFQAMPGMIVDESKQKKEERK